MISNCLCLKVLEQVSFELLFQTVTVKSEQTLQAISNQNR